MAKIKLYRLFDEDRNLLYIGVSLKIVRRLREHKSTNPWFKNVKNIEIENFNHLEDALQARKHSIKEEKPRFNKIHNQTESPPHSKSVSSPDYSKHSQPHTTTITRITENPSPYGFEKSWPWKINSKKEEVVFHEITIEFDTIIDAKIFIKNNKIRNPNIKFNEKTQKYFITEEIR